ncbi:MAG: YciI family protein [Candidatus Dormibacteraeota bacterium]|nr:YciI family protein [Candidatus Dormibacteraeota bacterium]
MKYVLMFCADGDDVARFEAMSQQELAAQYEQVGRWFAENGSKITGGNQLAAPSLATTVRFDGDGRPLVTDGPFLEANEVIGGYAEVEVEDLDEALRMAKSWPPGGAVEIRPVSTQGPA